MTWLRDLGPLAVATTLSLIALWGWVHGDWPQPLYSYLLFFSGFLLLASLTERSVSARLRGTRFARGP